MKIAIDGPSSSGKSTVARILAHQLQFVYVDTGAMYRALTWLAKDSGVAYGDEVGLTKLAETMKLEFQPAADGQLVKVNGCDVTLAIRTPEVTNNVSQVSAFSKVRTILVEQQRQLAAKASVVMDGRDIGTTVLPNAEVKVFLVASVATRAQRRFLENQAKGITTSLEQLEAELAERDYKDSHRAISPLKQAPDAQLIDTSHLTIDEVVDQLKKLVDKKMNLAE